MGGLEPVHDVAGQLASIRQGGVTLASYRYNGDGQRVTRIEGSRTVHTIYDDAGHWLGDYDASGRAIAQAIWLSDYPVGLIVDGRALYIEPDHLGTPRALIDPVRNVPVDEVCAVSGAHRHHRRILPYVQRYSADPPYGGRATRSSGSTG